MEKTFVYICSAGHSGSTLLDMMIGSHPLCESLGELSLLPMDIAMGNRCGCGSHYRECPFWSPILDVYSRDKGINVWESPYALNLGYMAGINIDRRKINTWYKLKWMPMLALKFIQHRFSVPVPPYLVRPYDQGTRNTLDLYDRILAASGKLISVDSTKRYSKAASLYLERPENTRLIVLVRDGRGVYYSGLKRKFSRGYSLKTWYNYYNRALPNLRKNVCPEHLHLVRYEDLVTNPEATLQGICRFLKIDFVPEMLSFSSIAHHIVNGNEMKFSSTSELKLDLKWQSDLRPEDLSYFQKHAGKLNEELGYR